MFLANKQDRRSNAFSCVRYGVPASHATMSIFAQILPICATGASFACATLLRTIVENLSFSQPWRVIAAHRLFATQAETFLPAVVSQTNHQTDDVIDNHLSRGLAHYGTPLPRHPKIKKIMHITRNRKNKTFAIPADAAAMPPNPSTAATNAIIRNVTAQPNIMSPP